MPDVWYNRGNKLREIKRDQEAVASFENAIDLKQNFVQALNNRGSALHKLARYSEAVAKL